MEFDLDDPLLSFKEQKTCTISELFASESDHMLSPNYLSSTNLDVSFRCEAISLILQAQFSCNLDPFVAYLAVNYLDRFMSRQEIPQGKPWLPRLIVISCLSLASKMNNTPFLSLSDLQKEGCTFEAQGIKKMELIILGALKWRMRSITPFPFLHFFISVFELKDSSLKQALKERASEIIFNALNDVKFLEYKPSTIAASALIYASNELFPLQYSTLRASMAACEYLDEEILSKCFNFMQEMVRVEANESISRYKPFKHRNSSDCDGEKHQDTDNLMVSIAETNSSFVKLRRAEEAEGKIFDLVHMFSMTLVPLSPEQEPAQRAMRL